MQVDSLQQTLVPCNIEAEEKFIGSLLLSPNLISEAMINIRPHFFYKPGNMFIYEALCALYIDGHPVTVETIANSLKTKTEMGKSKLELIGGAYAISSCIEGASPEESEYWGEVIKKKHDERELYKFANEARIIASSSPEDIEKARGLLEEKLIGLSGKVDSMSTSIDVAISELDDRLNKYINDPEGISGLETGLHRLDKTIDGLQKGNVSIVYAPSSRYKSLFTANLGWRLAERNIPGLWLTTEMPKVQVLERILQLESGLNVKWLRRDKRILEHKKALKAAQERMSKYPIYFCDASTLDVSDVRAMVNRHSRWHNIEYVIVDLVDHIYSSRFKDEAVNNQRFVMSSMKQIAKDYNVHIILVSHVGKGSRETRRNADLDVEEMLGSGAKYQDVDVAISIAPVTYNEKNEIVAMSREEIIYNVAQKGVIDVCIAVTKNRHGELDRFILELDFKRGLRFYENGWVRNSYEEKQLQMNEGEEDDNQG